MKKEKIKTYQRTEERVSKIEKEPNTESQTDPLDDLMKNSAISLVKKEKPIKTYQSNEEIVKPVSISRIEKDTKRTESTSIPAVVNSSEKYTLSQEEKQALIARYKLKIEEKTKTSGTSVKVQMISKEPPEVKVKVKVNEKFNLIVPEKEIAKIRKSKIDAQSKITEMQNPDDIENENDEEKENFKEVDIKKILEDKENEPTVIKVV